MPVGRGNIVVLIPPDDQPYMTSQFKLPSADGLQPIHYDFELKRGIWARGRVTDRATGQPLEARLRYFASATNPHVDEVVGIREIFYDGYSRGNYFTRDDGSYALPVLPGAGVIDVEAMTQNADYVIEAQEGQKPNAALFLPRLNELSLAWSEIRVGDDADAFAKDFALDAAPFKTLSGVVLDPDGKSLSGARYYGMVGPHWWTEPQKTERFVVTELRPSKPRSLARLAKVRDGEALSKFLVPEATRPVVFYHPERQLAGFTEVGWSTPEPITVRLGASATATGRIVDAEGHPRANFGMQPSMILKNRLRKNEVPYWQDRIFTDATGRFRLQGLVPNMPYKLFIENSQAIRGYRAIDVPPLRPGEARDLGDIKANVLGEPG
jgi:hypothetical protein